MLCVLICDSIVPVTHETSDTRLRDSPVPIHRSLSRVPSHEGQTHLLLPQPPSLLTSGLPHSIVYLRSEGAKGQGVVLELFRVNWCVHHEVISRLYLSSITCHRSWPGVKCMVKELDLDWCGTLKLNTGKSLAIAMLLVCLLTLMLTAFLFYPFRIGIHRQLA